MEVISAGVVLPHQQNVIDLASSSLTDTFTTSGTGVKYCLRPLVEGVQLADLHRTSNSSSHSAPAFGNSKASPCTVTAVHGLYAGMSLLNELEPLDEHIDSDKTNKMYDHCVH